MKKILGLLSVVLVFSLPSCLLDLCEDTTCGDFGVCEDGFCVCDTGYEQDSSGTCSILMREKFLGTFLSNSSCSLGSQESYSNTITESPNGLDRVTIGNVYGYINNTVTATITEGGNLTIAPQITPDQFNISGSGSINGDIINLNFVIIDNITNVPDTCNLIMTRQL